MFPAGRHDDQADMMSQAGTIACCKRRPWG
jgi:phage terminase large subunit-like protein